MKKFARVLALAMAFAMMLSLTAFAADNKTTWIVMSLEDDEGTGETTYRVRHTGESSHYLTEASPLLIEIVQIVNSLYDPNDPSTEYWDFDTKAMKEILDFGLKSYAEGPEAWGNFVEEFYQKVNVISGSHLLKGMLQDQTAVLGDLTPNVPNKVTFKNEVKGDNKYGVTYTMTLTRYTDTAPALAIGDAQHDAYVQGYPDGTVRPNANITRAEVATIFYRLMTEESRAYYQTKANTFTDVAETAWYNEAVSTMAAAGVLRGYEDGSFRPNANVTRAEFVSIVTRMTEEGMGNLNRVYKHYFNDVAKGAWYTGAVELGHEFGWALGFEGKYRPEDNMTRAEVMTMVNRVLARQVKAEDMLKDMIVWPDNVEGAWYYEAVQEATNSHSFTRTNEQAPQQDFNYEVWTALEN